MPGTLIFCRENAQLGNRLIVYAHLLAATRERGWNLVNPTFEPYAHLFEGSRSRPHGRSQIAVRVAWQCGKFLSLLSCGKLERARARGVHDINLEETLLEAERKGARWLLLQGFRIRCPQWVAHHAPYLRDFFKPIDEHRLPAEAVIAGLRQRGTVVVGIHIRHGDYAQHLGGRFFYTIAQYVSFMHRLRELLAPATVSFVICTHVPIPSQAFEGFIWAPGPGSSAGDLHALSRCDYIVGPPSSFSAWAAFHGATRLLHIEQAQQEWSLADFHLPLFPEILH